MTYVSPLRRAVLFALASAPTATVDGLAPLAGVGIRVARSYARQLHRQGVLRLHWPAGVEPSQDGRQWGTADVLISQGDGYAAWRDSQPASRPGGNALAFRSHQRSLQMLESADRVRDPEARLAAMISVQGSWMRSRHSVDWEEVALLAAVPVETLLALLDDQPPPLTSDEWHRVVTALE